MNYPHEVFTEKTFYPKWFADLDWANGRVAVHVPYATVRRVRILRPELQKCINRGVVFCCMLEKPQDWNPPNNPPELKPFEGAVGMLLEIGAHVQLRKRVHEKVITIDRSIAWDGSLNALSWFDTSERMNRFESLLKVKEATATHGLDQCAKCFPIVRWNFTTDAGIQAYLEHVGKQIALWRRNARLTQKELAQVCSLTQDYVSDIEHGKHDFRTSTINQVLDALDIHSVQVPRHLLPAVMQLLERESRVGSK